MRSGDVKSKTKSMEWTEQGVGGLVMTTIHTGINAGTYSPAYDGNGNIVAYINAENGTIVAALLMGQVPSGNGMIVDWAMFKEGHLRINKIEELTVRKLRDFMDNLFYSKICANDCGG